MKSKPERGRSERPKLRKIKLKNAHMGNYAVQRTGVTGRKEKEHSKATYLRMCARTRPVTVWITAHFSNDVFNYEVTLELWAQKYMHVALLLVSETK